MRIAKREMLRYDQDMKKFFTSFTFLSKLVLLLFLLIFGWVFTNVGNFVRWKKGDDKNVKKNSFWGVGEARADIVYSTPFLSCFDGKSFKIENDVLFGRPTSFHPDVTEARKCYENGFISPDLYKITAPVKPYGGKLLFQIHEVEPEESFVKWVELVRVIHPRDTEVIVNSDYQTHHVVKRDEFESRTILPERVVSRLAEAEATDVKEKLAQKLSIWDHTTVSPYSVFFHTGESMDFVFRGLKVESKFHLVMKSWYRDWTPGPAEDWQSHVQPVWQRVFSSSSIRRASALVAAFAGWWVLGKRGIHLGFLPIFVGTASSAPGCSFILDYKTIDNTYQHLGVVNPRAWKYNSEVFTLQDGLVQNDGTLTLRVTATKRHALGFIGIVENMHMVEDGVVREESLTLTKAHHHRLNSEITKTLSRDDKEFVHTIPGDVVTLEFEPSKTKLNAGEKETFLFRSSGFYTSLSREAGRLAGNWLEKIPAEAKERSFSLTPLRHYS